MILKKNVKISGNDTDAWGCQIVTSDFQEGNNELRVGYTFFDNVEVHNCSQYDTYKAAFRFEGAKLGNSKISNSAIHHGLGMAINIEFSENGKWTQNHACKPIRLTSGINQSIIG